MKRWLTALYVAAFAVITAPPARSQDADPPIPPAQIRVDVQMVSIPVSEAGRLVPALQDRKKANDAWTRLQAMIASGEASLTAWPVLQLQNRQRGAIESIAEFRYQTEFNPPQGPGMPFPPAPRIVASTWGPKTPSAFETRNTGCTLEAEATIEQDSKVISLNLVAQMVRLLEIRKWHTQASPAGVSGVQEQPDFQTLKITTSLDARSMQPELIGVFVVPEPKPHVELFILHAKATLLPASTFLPPPAK
ncbi:MAG TPA: hypothetical protein VK961_07950 [Chthoniobacter sp.]|nr:hypothetical protein [Chthoniobacter sp.]